MNSIRLRTKSLKNIQPYEINCFYPKKNIFNTSRKKNYATSSNTTTATETGRASITSNATNNTNAVHVFFLAVAGVGYYYRESIMDR